MAEAVPAADAVPSGPDSLEGRLLGVIAKYPKGATDDALTKDLGNVSLADRVAAINSLLAQQRLELLKLGTQIVYRAKAGPSASLAGLSVEERLVYQIIQAAGNKGIWTRDLRYQSNLQQTQINKILKVMEGRKMVKAVKSVVASKKKVYMLYELEPDRTLTGGAWYSEQEFESEFVEVLTTYCFKFLAQKRTTADAHSDPISRRLASFVTPAEVGDHISRLGLSKIELSPDDIACVLDALVYDGRVDREVMPPAYAPPDVDPALLPEAAVGTRLYRAGNPLGPAVGILGAPCGVCPVIHNCREGAPISPQTCAYYKQWLDF